MVKAASFNIRYGTAQDGLDRWDNRREAVIELMRGWQADVIGLQEALAFQADEVGAAMEGYGMVYACRDDGQRAGEACPILFRQDRFERVEGGTFWFSATPETPGSKTWGNTLPRVCTWARLQDRATGRGLFVYNLHLDHESQPSREESLALLAERIGSRLPKEPFIVMGDFNIRMENPALRPLTGEGQSGLRLVDTWRVVHGDEDPVGTFHKFTGAANPQTGKIDHILVGEGTEVVEASIDQSSVDGRWPSDHFPVLATVNPYED